MWFEFSENNSGGSWWLNRDQYIALLKSGKWGIDIEGVECSSRFSIFENDDVPYVLRHNLVGQFNSQQEAEDSWESLTGYSLEEEGCECCGRPFSLYQAYSEPSKGVMFFDKNFSIENLTLALKGDTI